MRVIKLQTVGTVTKLSEQHIHDYSVKHNNINIFSMTSIKQHLYKNLSPNFKLNRFLYRGGLNCKFYPDRFLNLRFLLMGFYCIV